MFETEQAKTCFNLSVLGFRVRFYMARSCEMRKRACDACNNRNLAGQEGRGGLKPRSIQEAFTAPP